MQWAAWSAHSPIGDERCFDVGSAMIRKTMVDMNTPKGSHTHPVEDYLPFHFRRPDISDVDQQLIRYFKSLELKS